MKKGVVVLVNEIWGEAFEIESVANKVISGIELVDNEYSSPKNKLVINFQDGSRLHLVDDGQNCCETKWMHTDDELSDFIGATFLDAEVRDGPTTEDESGDPTESQFLIIRTSVGAFTIVNYNEHNGYYGGFSLSAELLPPQPPQEEVV